MVPRAQREVAASFRALAWMNYILASGVCSISPPPITGRPFLELAISATMPR
jgi:hypothetical protein